MTGKSSVCVDCSCFSTWRASTLSNSRVRAVMCRAHRAFSAERRDTSAARALLLTSNALQRFSTCAFSTFAGFLKGSRRRRRATMARGRVPFVCPVVPCARRSRFSTLLEPSKKRFFEFQTAK